MIKFCSLYSGSSGNSLFISDGTTRILIDAGLSAKKIILALHSIGEKPEDISAVLISHEHVDHTRGVGIISRKFKTSIYANENTWNSMENDIGPVLAENKVCFNTGEAFSIGEITVKAFPIPHDASEPVGFNFFLQDKKITTATDIGHINDEVLGYLEDSDILLLESNHDVEMLKVGPYPYPLKRRILSEIGHLSNEVAGEVIAHMAEKGTKIFFLGHLSKENNFPELAYQTTFNALIEKKLVIGVDITLEVALRDRVSSVVEI